MAWTFTDLRTAYVVLSPAPATLAAAVATLNAQTTPLTQPQNSVDIGEIQGVLLLSGDWLKIQTEAAKVATGALNDPPTLAQLAIQVVQGKAQSVTPPNWATFLQMLGVLQAAGVVSSTSYTAIAALAPLTAPTWQPPVQIGDLQTALGVA